MYFERLCKLNAKKSYAHPSSLFLQSKELEFKISVVYFFNKWLIKKVRNYNWKAKNFEKKNSPKNKSF